MAGALNIKEIQQLKTDIDALKASLLELLGVVKNTDAQTKGKTAPSLKEVSSIQKERLKVQNQLKTVFTKNLTINEKRNKVLAKGKLLLQQNAKAQKDLTKFVRAQKGSIDKLTTANIILEKRLKGINLETEKGRKRAEAYRKTIDRNTVAINKNSSAQNRQKQSIGRYSDALKGVGTKVKALASGFIGLTTIIFASIRAMTAAIRVNREFEKSFTPVLGLLDELDKKEFGGILRAGSIEVMSKFGLAIEDVNKALFDTISNGIKAGDAIEFLNKSAILAKAGNSELSSVVKGATKVYEIYKDEVTGVDEILNAFFAAQVKGATTVEQLANNIGKIASIAKFAGIPINELFGTFAGLTKFLDGTEESATALTATIRALIKTTPESEKAFKRFGIETGATAIQQNGLLNTLVKVARAVETDADELTKLIPNVKALKGIAGLTTTTIKELEKNILDLNDAELSAALVTKAFTEQMGTEATQSALLKSSFIRLSLAIDDSDGPLERMFKNVRNATTATIGFTARLIEFQNQQKQFQNSVNTGAEIVSEFVETLELTDEELDSISETVIDGVVPSLIQLEDQIKKLQDTAIRVIPILKNLSLEDSLAKENALKAEQIQLQEQHNQALLTAFKLYGATKQEIENVSDADITGTEQMIDVKQAFVDQSIMLGNELFAFNNTISENRLANVQELLDQELISEKQFAIESAKIQRKQAIFDKVQAAFNIGIDTAQAIVGFLANPGGPAGIALSIGAGVIGLASAATVLAKDLPEIPQFYKGGITEGGAIIAGEKGTELGILPSGKTFLTPDSSTLIPNLPKGTEIIPHLETEMIMQGGMSVEKFDELIQSNKDVKKAILNKPENNTNFTDNGMKYTTKRNNTYFEWVDKYIRN